MKIEKWIADALVHCLEEGQPPAERYTKDTVPMADRYYKLEFSSRNERHVIPEHDQLSLKLKPK